LDVSYFTGVLLQRKSFKIVDSPGVVMCLQSGFEMMRKKGI